MPGATSRGERLLWRPLAAADALMNRLYGWRYNPLYQSGSLVVALLAVVIITGIYLTVFYRLGGPYESVARLTEQPWAGRWIRSLHRYASDAAVVAAAVHALRLFAQGRAWGPRALGWISGVVLLLVILVCGWTGYVMVWDVQAQVLAVEGARLLDALPIFAEPISRAFVGEKELPTAFFFLNLFLHIALPVLLGLILWVHVSRVARPALLPPRALMWAAIGLLTVSSIVWPISMAPKADLFRLPGPAPFDAFYSFWLPLSRALSPHAMWALMLASSLPIILIPWISKPRAAVRPSPSRVAEQFCTGCEQCYLDCPYEAIAMLERTDHRAELFARVDPALCVSCGICAGSCAPMGVGPANRTGRDQLAEARAYVQRRGRAPDVLIVACDHGAAGSTEDEFAGAPVYRVGCAGSVHTSVIEYFVRVGARGVLVAACPPRDCWNREGPKWLAARLYEDREAELQARVDRRRLRLVFAASGEARELREALAEFRAEIAALESLQVEDPLDLIRMCEPAEQEAGS